MLSIIIPTFSSAEIIGRCLVSVGTQTFTDFEIVIQDGLSKDSTLDLIKEFQQANNQIKVQTESVADHGVYDALNRGVSRSRGYSLYFLGTDDDDKNALKTVMRC